MQGFFNELRRRKVPRTAIVYAVVAWAIIESSSVIFPALHLPDWTVTFVVVLALIGFPVTLLFAWIFDVTRTGIVRTPAKAELPPEQLERLGRGRLIDFAIIAVLLAVIGWLGWERVFERDDPAGTMVLDSIAVLPFANMSGDPENEYFGDGLAEELLNALVRVEGLRVAARTSSFEYRGRHGDVRRIAEALGVATILEGSVRKAGDRVRVSAQLVRADDGFHLWSESYDRRLEDIFAVQDEIALAIVDALRVTLGARERERVVARTTRDIEAFEAYLRGRFEMHRRSPESLRRATEEFRTAISRDADYAAAYSGLSDTWMLRQEYDGVPIDEALRQAEPMARRALQLDPELAEAHASLGLVLQSRGDFAAAIGPLRRAIELNPSYSPAYHWLSIALSASGRMRESVAVLRKVLEIDPEYVGGKRNLLNQLRGLGEHEEADAFARQLLEQHGHDALVLYSLAIDAQQQSDDVQAVELAVRAVNLQPDAVHLRHLLAAQLAWFDDFERADRQMAIAAQRAPQHPLVMLWPAQRGAIQGDEQALREGMQDFLSKMPESLERAGQACVIYGLAGLAEEAIRRCRELLERLGWRDGEPLPVAGFDAAGILYANALLAGDQEAIRSVGTLLERDLETLAVAGLDPERVADIDAMLRMLQGDVDPFLERISAATLRRLSMSPRLDRNPFFEQVRGEPRFRAAMAGLQADLAAGRTQVDRIAMPESVP